MEFRSSPSELGRAAEVVVSSPDGGPQATVELSGPRVTVGRHSDANDIALEPDPELLVTRAGHCAFEREATQWFVADGGSVNGTFPRRGGPPERCTGAGAIRSGGRVSWRSSDPHARRRHYSQRPWSP